MITAFYVPKDLEYLKISTESTEIANCYIDDQPGIELDELLRRASGVPTVPADALENFLELARDGACDPINDHRSEMIIDEIDYVRVVPVHPYIPLSAIHYSRIYIEVSSSCTVYYEGGTLATEERRDSYQRPHTLYSPTANAIIRVTDGMVYFDGDVRRSDMSEQLPPPPVPGSMSIPDHPLDDTRRAGSIIRPQN
jgi:hypothetical protein